MSKSDQTYKSCLLSLVFSLFFVLNIVFSVLILSDLEYHGVLLFHFFPMGLLKYDLMPKEKRGLSC